ncbi:hypothetical protein ACH4VR_15560 [Streptomyces sp. NPDC020883]|uniref:hypothetical protein n=1 Tax=Streptomyces sp. NPDC020883 TaxID=3365099 RepID=UPI0037A523B9
MAMLSAGGPTAGTLIGFGDIYRHLHTRLRADGLPVPQQCGTHTADLLGLVRNVHSAHTAAVPDDASGVAVADDGSATADDDEPEPVPVPAKDGRLRHAERIASTIADGRWRARALTNVVLAAATELESDHVGRLLERVENAVNTIGDGCAQVGAPTAAATAVSALDPDRAEHIANTITDKQQQARALAPERLASAIAREEFAVQVLAGVARAVAAADSDHARRIADPVPSTAKAEVLYSMVVALIKTTP